MVKGEIEHTEDIIFYTIRVSLDDKKKDAVVTLTPLKGDFIIYATRNGDLPTKANHEFISQDHYLILGLNQQHNKEVQEYIIGV